MPVNTPCGEYEAAAPKWKRLRDCYAGRDAVLAGKTEYLPALPGKPEGYKDYQVRASFYNAVFRTVNGLAGTISQKAPTTPGTAAERIRPVLDDATPRGKVPFELVVLRAILQVLHVGRVAALVDMPAAAAADQRPYVVLFMAEDAISWRLERRGSDEVLTRVVLREAAEAPDPKDPFVMKCVTRYRVLELVDGVYTQTVWVPKDEHKHEFVPGDPETPLRRGKPLDFIPFTFIGPTSVSPDIEKPPLLDLADVNLAHYRNSADHELGLHLVALPTPWVAGVKGDDKGPMPIGPSVVWELEKDGTAGMLEFQGSGLDAIKQAMELKQRHMATLGARLLEEQPSSAETLGAVSLRHAGEHATLRTVAQAIECGLTMVLRWLAWWVGTEAQPADADIALELNKEFAQIRATPDEVRSALLAYQADGISFETFYDILRRGGWAREGVTADDERAALSRDGARRPPPPPVDDGGAGAAA